MTSAVATAADNKDLITASLEAIGFIRAAEMGQYGRAKMNGVVLEMGGESFQANPKKGEPAVYARLLDVPRQHHGMWITPDDANRLGRPEAADQFCKSYYDDPDQGGKVAQDGTKCESCPVYPFVKRESSPLEGFKKCSWRADLEFHHVDKTGARLDDTLWTLSLPTTSVIELMGTSKEKTKGTVSDLNFYQKLGRFAITAFPDLEASAAIARIGVALKTGGLIVGISIVMGKSQDGSRSFPIAVLDPVNIVFESDDPEPVAQLPVNVTPTDAPADPAAGYDDLPF